MYFVLISLQVRCAMLNSVGLHMFNDAFLEIEIIDDIA